MAIYGKNSPSGNKKTKNKNTRTTNASSGGGMGFTAIETDKSGRVVSQKSGRLTPVTREEFVGVSKVSKMATKTPAKNKARKTR